MTSRLALLKLVIGPRGILLWGFITLIKLYQWGLSPLKDALFGPGCCRFYPSCSQYSLESFKRHGAWKGCMLTFKRIAKCHPYHPGGVDEVPH